MDPPAYMDPVILIAALHLYHVLAFDGLSHWEWVHHLAFVPTMVFLAFMYDSGPLASTLSFWISGLPGGLSHALLALSGHRVMSRLTEKRWNARIQVWLRAPALLCTACAMYVSWLYGSPEAPTHYVLVIAFLIYVNAQYYAKAVVGNLFKRDPGQDEMGS